MRNNNLMNARQIKAARALLGWLQDDLANASGLSVATIRKLELGYISPRSATMAKIREAFEGSGLEFLDPDGVRHRQEYITTYTAPDGTLAFFDDILKTMEKKKGDLLIVSKSGSLFEFDEIHAEQCMRKISDLKDTHLVSVKCLLTENYASPLTAALCECRQLSKHFVDPAPFFVYGDKYALFENRGLPKIIVIQSMAITQSMRQQFYSMWEKAMVYGGAEAQETGRKLDVQRKRA